MKFPLFSMTKSLALGSMMLLTLLILTVADVNAQLRSTASTSKDLVMAVGHDIRGCHNGQRGTPELPCTGGAWANGNMTSNDSQWIEGEFVAIRDVITGLTAGSTGNTITLEYDTTKAGKHAYDYLGTYDTSTGPPNGPGGNDPCSGTGVTCSGGSTFAVPHDPNIPFAEPVGRNITMWNAVITNVSAPVLVSGTYAGDSITSITITYDVNPGVTTAVLAFGAHVGSRLDWGVNGSAVAINGSPYHISIGGGGGGQVQMSASAAIFPAIVTIIKEVRTLGAPPGTTATFGFNFLFSQDGMNSPFTLVDDVVGDGGGGPPLSTNATEVFSIIRFGTGVPITVTEANYAPVWTLSSINCVEAPGGLPNVANTTTSLGTRTANIIAEEAELIVCTFRNTQLTPTAAPASISGRTVDSFGNGIANTRVTVTDAQSGQTYFAITNPFGYYTVEGPEVGNFYIMTVSNKRYTFADDTRSFTLNDNLTDVDFIANP